MIVATFCDKPATRSLFGKGQEATCIVDSDTESDDSDEVEVLDEAIGWAYVGSHNFTPSAWGTLSGSAFNPILNVSGGSFLIIY